MFPASKLRELSPRTRMRKIARILQGMEIDATAGAGGALDKTYLRALISILETDTDRPGANRLVAESVRAVRVALESASPPTDLLRAMNALRHTLLAALGAEPAEWDMVAQGTGFLDRSTVRVRPFAVYLDDVRSPFNVGSLFRTAEAFGAQKIILSRRTPQPTHPRAVRTSLGATSVLPWEVADIATLSGMQGVFALETGGISLNEFPFPEQGVVILGSEELGVSPEALALADDSLGRVSIPLAGAKRSLNVSVAFGILMQAWSSARESRQF
jgi:RNA methyltransferase, TrmH family